MTRPTGPFVKAAKQNPAKKKRGFTHAYDELIKTIETMTRHTGDLNSVEPQLKEAFRTFLKNCNFHLAGKNFEALLAEKSGDNFLRNDGSVGWYHEFIPIMMALSAVRKGQRSNGVDLTDLMPHGGLEVAIASHLRHDSIEDFVTEEALRQQQYAMLEEIRAEGHTEYASSSLLKVDQIVTIIDLMSQKKLTDADGNVIYKDGKALKEDVVTYISRLVYSAHANPIAFMMKQADIVHNFATMFGAGKFPPERRAKRCNEKENMYGLRQSFYDDALFKWKPFAKVFGVFDGNMGETLYMHFRYLENVDLFYKDAPEAFRREPNNFPVNHRFLKRALQLDLPEIIHPLHIFLKRMQNSVDPVAEPEKYERFVNLMDTVIKPSLERYKERFPYIFQSQANVPAPASTPIAFS